MTHIEAILHRSSTRTFNGLHLDRQITDSITDYCRKICGTVQPGEPEPFANVPRPVVFLMPDRTANGQTGTYGVIKGACAYLGMACGDTMAEQMLGGYIFEKVILECTARGIDSCWLGGTFRHTGFQKEFEILTSNASDNIQRTVNIVSPIGHRTPKKRFAERVFRAVASSDSRKPFATLFNGIASPDQTLTAKLHAGDFSHLNATEKTALALECVRLAPSSTNSQPWRAHISHDSNGNISCIRFTSARTGKFTPYDMGIAYAHFCEASAELGLSGSWHTASSATPTELNFTPDTQAD